MDDIVASALSSWLAHSNRSQVPCCEDTQTWKGPDGEELRPPANNQRLVNETSWKPPHIKPSDDCSPFWQTDSIS